MVVEQSAERSLSISKEPGSQSFIGKFYDKFKTEPKMLQNAKNKIFKQKSGLHHLTSKKVIFYFYSPFSNTNYPYDNFES